MTDEMTSAVVELLTELVACPSVNPRGHGAVEPPYGEGPLMDLLHAKTSAWGAEATLDEVFPGRPNLIARWPGRDRSRTLMLEAHGDTVPATDMTGPSFEPEIKDGRLYGRGACDTKGPMTAMLLAITKVIAEDGAPPTDVCFVSTCDEEHGAGGANRLMESGFRADGAVVGEPTDLRAIWVHKGAVRWRLRTIGKSAHSSMPHTGVNAIAHMARAVQCIQETMIPRLTARTHPELGKATLSVGTIRGGTQVNVVPSECVIAIDRRLLPGEDKAAITAELTREMEALAAEVADFAFEIEETEYYPPLEAACDSAVALALKAACEQHVGACEFTGVAYGTNAGVFAPLGVPCIVFGPGLPGQAHQQAEYVDLDQVVKAVDIYADTIRAFGGA